MGWMKRIAAVFTAGMLMTGTVTGYAQEGDYTMHLDGVMGERYRANVAQWLSCAPYTNPGMVQMYFRRNEPHQTLVPWYGEFSGKYLTSVALAYAMEPDAALKTAGDYVVEQLAKAQDKDGYLGVWPDSEKLAGCNADGHKTWDAWSHYHNMLGLLLWHQCTGNQQAEQVLLRAADCLIDFFLAKGNTIDEDKDGTDAAIGHVFALLYREYEDERYLAMVNKCFEAFEAIHGGNYYQNGLNDVPFYKMERTRWECLHAMEAIKEMAVITQEENYRIAFENIWEGIAANDRHNTGGFSSGEAACGNPFDTRAIETCCTIAWMALSIDMLELTGDTRAADELELSTWNALLGAQHPSGRNFTYNTPMLGDKKASAHDIVFQAIAGSSELNCCSVNGPRGLGMIGQWGVTHDQDQVTVNYYGASQTQLETDAGKIVITQEGNYPFDDMIRLKVSVPQEESITLKLRIPFWSASTQVTWNGQAQKDITPGNYLTLNGVRTGDEVEIRFDMSLHFWQGNYELGGKTALYYGPILLACDQRFEKTALDALPTLQLSTLTVKAAQVEDTLWPQPNLLLRVCDAKGTELTLCDFASAGQTGTSYTTWLPTENEQEPWSTSQSLQPWGRRIADD